MPVSQTSEEIFPWLVELEGKIRVIVHNREAFDALKGVLKIWHNPEDAPEDPDAKEDTEVVQVSEEEFVRVPKKRSKKNG